AYTNAKNKALDYANALQLSLGQVVSVTDSYSSAPVTTPINDTPMLSLAASA
ncbi:MAG: SIMPL domain-containing protein, partial [Chitinophagaceae bacterium]